jgi:simple sugar transport system ATP-binding protein
MGDLSIGEKQRVEILKALYRDARILILDEPTAVLAPQESVQLFATLRSFVEAGLSIIFISHKLGEVLAVSDRVAILRQGRLEAVLPTHQADAVTLSMLMIGRSIERPVRPVPIPLATGAVVVPALSVDRVDVLDVREGARHLLRSVSLAVNPGEIVAIAGIAGNGQQALAELVCGLRSPDAGTVRVEGKLLGADPIDWIRAGVGRIPEDRQHLGVIAEASIAENAVAEHYREPPYARGGWRVDRAAIDQAALQIVADYDVRCRNIGQATSQLSGGNIQKLLLGRVLSRHPRLIIADQPTWGLDVGAIAWIHARLMSAAAQGAAILLISEELDEIFALADRVAVISQGQLSKARPVAQWTIQSLGLAMTGSLSHEQAASDAT